MKQVFQYLMPFHQGLLHIRESAGRKELGWINGHNISHSDNKVKGGFGYTTFGEFGNTGDW